MINNEPTIKKRKSNLKLQYIYNAVLLLVLTLGIAYSFVFFLQNEQGVSSNS